MTTIPYTEFTAWIKQQPPDRPIDMRENTDKSTCGCLMIQYAREHNVPCTSVGFYSFDNGFCTEAVLDRDGMALIHRCLDHRVTSYSQVIPLL